MDRRKFLTAAAASILAAAAAMPRQRLRQQSAREDHLKWSVFTPDSEVTFRTVMKPFAAAVERETNGAVVFDLFPNGALGRGPAQQAQMVVNGVADVAWVIPSYSPGRFPDTEVIELPGVFANLSESSPGRTPAGRRRRAPRLRRLLRNRAVGHSALFDPHEFPG